MRSSSGATSLAFAMTALAFASLPLAGQEAGIVSGQVVDADQGMALGGVLVRIGEDLATETNASGFFVLRDVPAGVQRLDVSHLGFGDHAREISVRAGEELSVTVRMSVEAIELEPFLVEAMSEVEERRRSSGNSVNEIQRPEIEAAARAGLGLTELLQTSMPGTMASNTGGSRTCVQYRAIRSGGRTGCREVSVVLDGIMVANPGFIYQTLPLDDIQRVEMLSPGQAGIRYGTGSGQAVLIIETRTGQRAQRADASKFVTGLEWVDEGQTYPWWRVLGSTFLVNAVTVGASLALADECLYSPDVGSLGLRTRCNGFNTASVGILSVAVPAMAGAFVGQWQGTTDRTRGRRAPAALAAAMALTGGYLLMIQGGDAGQVGGAVILSVGVPLALTLSDRIFRVLR